MSTKYYEPKESIKILKKHWINQKDFYVLIGKENESIRQLFIAMKEQIKKDLSDKGKLLPDNRHLPIGLVLDYLKDYGITRESILENAK